MANDPLIIDTDNRQDPKALQTKVTYAGDALTTQPYIAVTQDSIHISAGAGKSNGLTVSDQFGTTIGGKLSLSMMPDQISIGGGYWRLNPLLLSCIPSTTPTPVPVLVKDTPNLLSAKDDISSSRDSLIANSDAA